MAGRPHKSYLKILHPITIKADNGNIVDYGEIPVLCPICHSHLVGLNGSQPLKAGSCQKYQCKNPCCPGRKYLKKGKQFTLQTSALFKDALIDHLKQILCPLLQVETTQKSLGKHYHRSPGLMTYIRHKVEATLKQRKYLEKLVLEHPLNDAVSLDEMFLTIEGEAIYVILATSYGKKKVLGVKVAASREENIMREVFNEAERNNGKPFSILTIDAWGGSIKMAKNLGRPITVVIHKHKAPYKKAVIWKIDYETKKQIIHKIGVKTNFFKTRHKREYWYMKETIDLTKPTPKKRGRKKGTKNGQGKGPYVKIPKTKQKTRGPKGVFDVFDKGRKGYAKVDPGKKQVRIAKGGSTTVGAVLNQVILVFGKMTIQNNLAENKNSVVEHRVWLSGPKDLENSENRIRTFLFFLNNPDQITKISIDHSLRGDLVYKELKSGLFGHILRDKFCYKQKEQELEGLN